MKKLTIFIALALLLSLGATPAYAQPPLPHAFYGTVEINGNPAPVGTKVEARGEGVITGIAGNPTVTTVSGIYGTSNPFEPRLIVQGNIEDETTITFYVNDVSTGQTYPFDSGETTPIGLSVTITEEEEVGVEPAAAPTIETNLFGTAASFRISDEGKILKTIVATSADGNLTMTIPQGTIALDKNGNPLSSLTAVIDPSPPDPPEGDTIIGLVYDFGPEGATFEPPITFTWSYDPDALPEDLAEEELVIAFYDADADAWVECDCTCDPETYCVTASVSHFCCFAIIGTLEVAAPVLPEPAAFSVSNLSVMPVEVGPGGLVTVTLTVANTGGTIGSYTTVLKLNGVKEAEKSVTVAAGGSQTVTFFVSIKETGSYTVSVDGLSASLTVVAPKPPTPPVEEEEEVPEVPAKPINWPLVGGLIAAAVVVVAILIYFLWVRPRAY